MKEQSPAERIRKEQSPEERIRFLEHGVQWRSDLLDQWKANQASLWKIVDKQEEMIEALTRQRDAARVELASMIATQQNIIGHKDYTPDQVLASRGWKINWSALDKYSELGHSEGSNPSGLPLPEGLNLSGSALTPTKEAKDAE